MNRFYQNEEQAALLGNLNTRLEPEKKLWDVFEDPPIEKKVGSAEEWKLLDFLIKVIKLAAYLVTFVVILLAATISKGTMLFMTSQIEPNQTRSYCNRELGSGREFVVQLPRVERVAWMWAIVFTFFVTELFTFLRSLRVCLFKTWRRPSTLEFVSCFITESLSAVGSAILVFCILPELDVVKGVMLTNAVCFVPAVVGCASRNTNENYSMTAMTLDIVSILAQVTAFVIWPMIENQPSMWLIPISALFISCGWWENYVSENSRIGIIANLGKRKKLFENSRYFIYSIVSLWKCVLFFLTVLVVISIKEERVDFLFEEFAEAFRSHIINITEIVPIQTEMKLDDVFKTSGFTTVSSDELTPVWVFLINVLSSYVCYAFGKWACKISIQSFSYAFPINLTVPMTITLLLVFCGKFNGDPCAFYGVIPSYLFFNIPSVYFLNEFLFSEHSYIWLFWMLSQIWITIHLWSPKCERLARTERLFVRPMYDAFLIDQSLAMNRRRDDLEPKFEDEDDKEDDDDNGNDNKGEDKKSVDQDDTIGKVYVCGTMWHETREEMMEFLKSIIRLDEDQGARRLVRNELEIPISDYYELEAHIFFDDAFIRKDESDNDPRVNPYVKELIGAVDDACSEVHQVHMKLRPPKKYVTPYGGRLVWTLPGQNKMIAHLKDKAKIRPKKRWSQVMYMYYLLGHKLMSNEDLTPKRKDIVAENTFILALDGDIDFQPEAVHLLMNLMKKNKALGAACGRLHPMGSGPLVWYQTFEYAIGHWLQKATEHVIGCVLCSPGCFTLFRAKALMTESVMKKYTTKSTEARHFVQYDQGEDRWLCTLLLQQGFRVEYSAAADAFTHCPEGFNEFYNQRRRWVPSTNANILDLLMDYKRTIKVNDSISRLYILYQVILMVGTVLGPGTIFLMLVGAFVAAFDLDQWSSFLWNFIPILIFLLVCALARSEIQLLFAGVISAIYGLVMMAVLVGVMLQISNDGILAPSSLFFFCVAGEMILTALMHPKEINCLLFGIVYYVTVPSMYLLLIIYSVFNLNNISWGTREVTIMPKEPEPAPHGKDVEKAVVPVTEPPKKKNKILAIFGGNDDDAGSIEFSIAGLVKFMFCTHRKDTKESQELIRVTENLKQLSEKLNHIEALVRMENVTESNEVTKRESAKSGYKMTLLEGSRGSERGQYVLNESIYMEDSSRSIISEKLEQHGWLENEEVGYGEQDFISTDENTFWVQIIEKYLYPFEDDKEKVARDLKDLRDKVVMAFFMLNAIFVLVVFLLTLKKDLLHINWPFGVKSNFTFNDENSEITVYKQYLELEPIGFVFLIFFASLLVTQFIAMLFHRFGTFSEILSVTYIKWSFFSDLDKKNLTEEQILQNDPVKVVKKLCKIKGAEDEDEEEEKEVLAPGRRKTVKHLAENSHKRQSINDLSDAFNKRTTLAGGLFTKNSKKSMINPAMIKAVNKRRSTVHLRRTTQLSTNMLPYQGSSNRGYHNVAFEEE